MESYAEIYERAIYNVQKMFITDDNLLLTLRDKRDFGLKKYGDKSFQSNFENTMNSPTLQHASEELIDAMNYIAHELYKEKIADGGYWTEYLDIMRHLVDVHNHIAKLIREKEFVDEKRT